VNVSGSVAVHAEQEDSARLTHPEGSEEPEQKARNLN